jgi:hypothetical protein
MPSAFAVLLFMTSSKRVAWRIRRCPRPEIGQRHAAGKGRSYYRLERVFSGAIELKEGEVQYIHSPTQHSNCLVVHYQNEQPNYQQRKKDNDDDRNNGVPASGRLAIGRFGRGFLRRSDTQQEAHLIPRSLNPAQADRRRRIALNTFAFAYAFAIANSIPGRCRRHRPARSVGPCRERGDPWPWSPPTMEPST